MVVRDGHQFKLMILVFTQTPHGDISMAKAPATKKKATAKKTPTKRIAVKKVATKKSGRLAKATTKVTQADVTQASQKNAFEEKFGEGTAFDLDYGKLLIIALCIYIAVKVS